METKKSDAELRAQFESSGSLKIEFGGDIEAFVAFRQADASGLVRFSGPKNYGMVTVEQFHAENRMSKLNGELIDAKEKLKSLNEVQKKIAEDEANQYATGVACTP